MDIEDAYENWDNLSTEERMEVLSDAANEYLSETGYDEVTVSGGDSNHTDSDTGNITINSDYLDDAHEAFDTIYHETWHSMDIQDGVYDRLPEDEKSDFNRYEDYHVYYEHNEPHMDYDYNVSEHELAEAFGNYMADVVRDAVEKGKSKNKSNNAIGAESAVGDFKLEINWDDAIILEIEANPDDAIIIP